MLTSLKRWMNTYWHNSPYFNCIFPRGTPFQICIMFIFVCIWIKYCYSFVCWFTPVAIFSNFQVCKYKLYESSSIAILLDTLTSVTYGREGAGAKGARVYHSCGEVGGGVKDYFLCLFSKRIVCKSEPEVHFYRKLRYAREDWQFQIKVPGFKGRALTP